MLGRGVAAVAALMGASVLVVLAGCATKPAAEAGLTAPVRAGSTIVLGAHAPLSGPLGPQWKRITTSTRAWFDYVNDHGGVDGRKIEYRVADDRSDIEVTKRVVRRLVEKDGVLAMVGNAGSATHEAVAGYLAVQKVPDLFVSSGDRAWDNVEGAPLRFGFAPDNMIEAKALATTLDRQYNGQSAVNGRIVSTQYCAVVEDSIRGNEILSGLEAVLKDGLVSEQRFAVTDTDLSAQVKAMRTKGCQVDVIGGGDVHTAAAMRAAQKLGYAPVWATPSLGGGIQTIARELGAGAERVDGLISTTALPIAQDDPWVKLFGEVNAKYGDNRPVDSDVIYGMSLGYAAVEALDQTGSELTRASLVKTMENGRVAGSGLLPLAYSSLSHAPYQGVGVTTAAGGIPSILPHQVMLGSALGPKVVEYLGAPVGLAGNGLPAS